MRLRFLGLLALSLAACSGPGTSTNEVSDDLETLRNGAALATGETVETEANHPPLEPPEPGTRGGLPDDRTPVAEAPFSETSAQGAANVVQTYYALLEQEKYREAWTLWSDGGGASGMSADSFAASFDRYLEYHANVGAPGRIEGAAGSLYVRVPVQVYGRLTSGEDFDMLGTVTLRRANDVPGSTPQQRKWHIASIDTGLQRQE